MWGNTFSVVNTWALVQWFEAFKDLSRDQNYKHASCADGNYQRYQSNVYVYHECVYSEMVSDYHFEFASHCPVIFSMLMIHFLWWLVNFHRKTELFRSPPWQDHLKTTDPGLQNMLWVSFKNITLILYI